MKLTPEAMQAMQDWNEAKYGRGTDKGDGMLHDPENIERLQKLALPGETPSDTVMRLFRIVTDDGNHRLKH